MTKFKVGDIVRPTNSKLDKEIKNLDIKWRINKIVGDGTVRIESINDKGKVLSAGQCAEFFLTKVRKTKKLKREVLGTGYPFFIYEAGKGFYAICLQTLPGRPYTTSPKVKLNLGNLDDLKKVKLVMEYK